LGRVKINVWSTEMKSFANMFSAFNNIETGENYDHAIYTILNFANQTGISL